MAKNSLSERSESVNSFQPHKPLSGTDRTSSGQWIRNQPNMIYNPRYLVMSASARVQDISED